MKEHLDTRAKGYCLMLCQSGLPFGGHQQFTIKNTSKSSENSGNVKRAIVSFISMTFQCSVFVT